MRILALDATTEACGVALQSGDGVIYRLEEPGRGNAERLLTMVDEVLAEAGMRLTALDALSVGIGPGAFTGVRITVAIAQGLAFGAGLPVVGIPSLEALAWRLVQSGAPRVLACLDARMGEVYAGAYRGDAERGVVALQGPEVVSPENLSLPAGLADDLVWTGIGRGLGAYPRLAARLGLVLGDADAAALPDARELASLGALRYAGGDARDAALLAPLYVRDQVAQTEAERLASRKCHTPTL